MSGLDHQVLNVLEPAVFATDPGESLGPQDSGGPSYVTLAAGWQVSDRPPARWLNWLLRAAGGMQRAVLGGALADWFRGPDATNTDGSGTVLGYHPSPGSGNAGYLAIPSSTNGSVYTSVDGGVNWSDIGAAPVLPGFSIYPAGITIDSANVLCAIDGDVYYDNSVEAWSPVSETPAGIAGDVTALITDYPASDLAIAAGADGGVSIRANGVGGAGSWVAATSAPKDSGSWDSTGIASLCRIDASTWVALTYGGQIWRSTDTADNWSLLSTLSGDGNCGFMVRCPHTGTLAVAQDGNTQIARIRYSHTGGVTWATSTLQSPPTPSTSSTWSALKTAGGGAFVASYTQAEAHGFWVCTDRGQSWYPAYPIDAGSLGRTITALGCDGKRLAALWFSTTPSDDGVYVTHALDGRGVPSL